MTAVSQRWIDLPGPVHVGRTLGHLRVGRSDPTTRIAGQAFARAMHTPDGPATLRLDVDGSAGRAHARAAGPGARWALAHAPGLLGCHDDLASFDPTPHEVVARFARRLPGLRLGMTSLVADILAPTILGQKVTGSEAKRSWHHLIALHDQPAPTGADLPDLALPPTAGFLADLPPWQYTAAGVDRSRTRTIIEAHRRIDALQAAGDMEPAARAERLTHLRGMGPWTAAIISREAFGDPDAVDVGDFHVPNLVAWNLAREPRGDDDRMLELLEPFRGHRGRVQRIIELAGQRAPSYGPKFAPRRFGQRQPPRPSG